MEELEKNCYTFILNLANELAQDYNTQYQNMEEFARWNLPEEIALEWIDAEGMVNILERGECVSKETVGVLREIISAFVLEFEKVDNPVWTHEAMQSSAFWNMQRLKASKVAQDMSVGQGTVLSLDGNS